MINEILSCQYCHRSIRANLMFEFSETSQHFATIIVSRISKNGQVN